MGAVQLDKTASRIRGGDLPLHGRTEQRVRLTGQNHDRRRLWPIGNWPRERRQQHPESGLQGTAGCLDRSSAHSSSSAWSGLVANISGISRNLSRSPARAAQSAITFSGSSIADAWQPAMIPTPTILQHCWSGTALPVQACCSLVISMRQSGTYIRPFPLSAARLPAGSAPTRISITMPLHSSSRVT